MDWLSAILDLHLRMTEIKDKVEHPRPLTFESRTYRYEPEFKIRRDEVSLTWTIFKKRPKQRRKEDKQMEHIFTKVDTIEREVDGVTEQVDLLQCHGCDAIIEAPDLDEAQEEPCPGPHFTVHSTNGPKVRPAVAIEQPSGVAHERYTPVFPDPFYHFDDE